MGIGDLVRDWIEFSDCSWGVNHWVIMYLDLY